MSFKYVYIPSIESQPMRELSASKEGGLQGDYLRKHAEITFARDSNLIDRSKQMAGIMAHLGESSKDVDANMIKDLVDNHKDVAGNVEIITLAIPTASNLFYSVSLYCDGNSSFKNGPNIIVNNRATNLLRQCGHKDTVIIGDCFVGRTKDDERVEWERVDFTLLDLNDSSSQWIKDAAKANAGKNLSSYSTSGSLNAMKNANSIGSQSTPALSLSPSITGNTITLDNPSEESIQMQEKSYAWTQSDEEIELRMRIPSTLPAKQLEIKILPNRVIIDRKTKKGSDDDVIDTVSARFAAESTSGSLLYRINASDSTWSIADEREGKVLTLNLSKTVSKHWPRLFADEK